MKIVRNKIEFKVYETPYGTHKSWTVTWLEFGRRKRKRISDWQQLEKFLTDKARELKRLSLGHLTDSQRAEYNNARSITAPYNERVDQAVGQWAFIRQHIPDHSVYEIVDFWTKHHPQSTNKSVSEVIEEMLAQKKQDGLSRAYLDVLKIRCEKFARSFKMPISALSGLEIDAWLRGLKVGAVSRNHYLTNITTLCAFAQTKGYLPKEWAELDSITKAKVTPKRNEIYTPSELRQLLTACPEEKLIFIVLGAFAGIRSAEIQRLLWEDIGENYIMVERQKIQTRSHRSVTIQPNLKAWVKKLRKDHSGPLFAISAHSLSDEMMIIAKRAGMEWKRNALRHSFISYHLAKFHDQNMLAIESNNSPAVIFHNYRDVVTPESAEEWFSIMPDLS